MHTQAVSDKSLRLDTMIATWARHLFPHYGIWLIIFALFAANCSIVLMSSQISVEWAWFEFNFKCFGLAFIFATFRYMRPQYFGWVAHRIWCAAVFIILAYVFASNLGLYNQLTMTQNWPFADAALITADRAIGFDWLFYAKLMTENQNLNEALNYAYSGLTGTGLLVAVLLGGLANNRERSIETAFLLVATGIFVVTFASFVPAEAAWVTLADSELLARLDARSGIDHVEPMMYLRSDGPIHILTSKIIGLATFPSYHTCLGLIILLSTRGYRFLAPMGMLSGFAIVAATPIYGGHYFVDVIAGTAVTAIAFKAWQRFILPALRADLPAFGDEAYAIPTKSLKLSFT